jgi:hypothetical protein
MVFGLILTGIVYRVLERRHVLAEAEFSASAKAR